MVVGINSSPFQAQYVLRLSHGSDELNGMLATSARAWLKKLSDLQELRIPRCLHKTSKMLVSVSLQTFVDASESAYGTVV